MNEKKARGTGGPVVPVQTDPVGTVLIKKY